MAGFNDPAPVLHPGYGRDFPQVVLPLYDQRAQQH